jgi:DNA-dependent RNA polymerase auxiliary subunit epsilon
VISVIGIYPIEFEMKDTTETDRSASYRDLHLEIDSERRLRKKLNNNKYDFNFPIVNFPFM